MAIVILGRSRCAICNEVIERSQEVVATAAFIEDPHHSLLRFSDAAMHQPCFLAWDRRGEFVAQFNRVFGMHYRGMRHMPPDGRIEEREPRPRGAA